VAGEPGALPLLSHALRATWERRDGRTLTVQGYRETGGVASAIARTADSVVASLPPEQGQVMRSIFLRLTEPSEGVAESRRRVKIEELVSEGVSPEVVEALLERLAEARLVTLGAGTAEVAHEVLIREWPTLRGWLDEDREGIRVHRQLGAAARLWDAGGRDPSDLYRGTRLGAAADWADTHREELNATERGFIDASVEEADRDRRAQLRANRRLRALLAGTAILLVIALLAGVVSFIERRHAQAQALTSDAERVGAQALTDPNVDHSLLLAVAGVRLQSRFETRSDLFADLQQNAALIRVIRPSPIEITALRVSPDGRLLAVGDSSGTVRFIDLASWRPRGAVVRLHEPVGERALSFSPDGHTLMVLAIGAERSELYAIDVGRRRARRMLSWSGPMPQPPIGFEAVAYSPDGKQVAVTQDTDPGESDIPTTARVVMRDASTGHMRWQRRYPLRPGQADPHVVFTPAGTLLTSAQQGDTLVWDLRTGRILRRFPLGGLPAVAPNGMTVALGQNSPSAGDQSAAIVLLDLRTGSRRALLANLPDHWIRSLAFTPDGAEIAGAATDGVHVWDRASGKIIESYVAQAGPRSLSALDPNTDILISGQQDGSLAAFDLSGGRRLGRAFSWNSPAQGCGYTPCMAVNRQSSLMATDQGDGTIAIVDLRTLRLARTLAARDGPTAAAISFMPDGRTLATGGVNRRVTFWDVDSGRVTRTLRFGGPVWWTAASPDGQLLAVQTGPADGSDNHVELVRIATGKVLQSHRVPHGPSGVEFSRDGRELVALGCCWTGSGSTLVAWDARTGRQLFSGGAGVDAAAFDLAPDPRLLGVGTEGGKFLLLDARSGKQTAPPIQVATGAIAQVSFSPDDRRFVVSSNDHTASVWDLGSRMRLGNAFGPYPGTVPAAMFEPNGHLLINLLSNAIEWPTDVNTWERFACRVAGRDLTRAEWHDLLPNRAYQPVCHP
jgi:WD40 repeat protein